MKPFSDRLPSFLSKLYLVRCYRQHKGLFILSIGFILAAAYGHKTNCEITPALVFSMYTGSRQVQNDSFFVVSVNGKPLDLHHTIDEPRRMMIYSSLAAFHQGVLAGYQSPEQDAVLRILQKHPLIPLPGKKALCTPYAYTHYLPWLRSYIRAAVAQQADRISISQVYFHYDRQDLPIVDSTRQAYAF